MPTPSTTTRAGRRPITSRAEVEHVAFGLFAERGFDNTTIDDVARAAGIGRRTFFRYFPSKNDIAWGDFDGELARMREVLAGFPPDLPLLEAIRRSLLEFNRIDPAEIPWHRRRMRLILTTPALQAHSTLRYAAWRHTLAAFVGRRLDRPADSLEPQAIAHATLGVAVAAYEQWLRDDASDLAVLLSRAVDSLAALVPEA
ncbi:MAG TPA: mycofactocin system transcriptional regulator [Pseudonocardiaceae bacterium]